MSSKLVVRQSTELDLIRIAKLGEHYVSEAKHHDSVGFDPEFAVIGGSLALRDENQLLLIASEDNEACGFLWGCTMRLPWSANEIAVDLVLYVSPSKRNGRAGLKLIREYEAWAKSRGVHQVRLSVVSGLDSDRTAELYERMGFTCIGTQHSKELFNVNT